MEIPFGKPILDGQEKELLHSVLDSGILVHGRVAEMFEEAFCEFTGAKYAISVSSCTAGMHLFYFVNDIGPGDEVILPAQTHAATAHAIEFVGAKPVFVDVDPITGNICPNQVLEKITDKTKAIAVVHYLGAMVDIKAITAIAKAKNILLIEDCALALGTKKNNVHAGLYGNCGVFSFYPVKHITTGEGGMVVTDDKSLADKIRSARAFGVDRHHGERRIPGDYEVLTLGFNYRMSELHAALGVVQMRKIEGFLTQRRLNFKILEELLSDQQSLTVLPQPFDENTQSSFYCLSMILPDDAIKSRPSIMERLTNSGVGSSIYYPKPVPLMQYYLKKYRHSEDEFPNANRISSQSIALPVGPHLNEGCMQKVAEAVRVALIGCKNG